MNATNLIEFIKRGFDILSGVLLGLFVGILILHTACDDEVPDDTGPFVVNKRPCSGYVLNNVGDECTSAAYGISLVNKKCKRQEGSGTNCVEIIINC